MQPREQVGMGGYAVRTALSRGVPQTNDEDTINVIEECLSKVEREFYRPVKFMRLKDETQDVHYHEQVFKDYVDLATIACGVDYQVKDMTYLPIGIREKADIGLEIANTEIEKAGVILDNGRDIFIVDDIQYKIVHLQPQDDIKGKWINTMVVGQNLNVLQPPLTEEIPDNREKIEDPFEDLP